MPLWSELKKDCGVDDPSWGSLALTAGAYPPVRPPNASETAVAEGTTTYLLATAAAECQEKDQAD